MNQSNYYIFSSRVKLLKVLNFKILIIYIIGQLVITSAHHQLNYRTSSFYFLAPLAVGNGSQPTVYGIPPGLIQNSNYGSYPTPSNGIPIILDFGNPVLAQDIQVQNPTITTTQPPPITKSVIFAYNKNILDMLNSRKNNKSDTFTDKSSENRSDNTLNLANEDPFLAKFITTVKRNTEHLLGHNRENNNADSDVTPSTNFNELQGQDRTKTEKFISPSINPGGPKLDNVPPLPAEVTEIRENIRESKVPASEAPPSEVSPREASQKHKEVDVSSIDILQVLADAFLTTGVEVDEGSKPRKPLSEASAFINLTSIISAFQMNPPENMTSEDTYAAASRFEKLENRQEFQTVPTFAPVSEIVTLGPENSTVAENSIVLTHPGFLENRVAEVTETQPLKVNTFAPNLETTTIRVEATELENETNVTFLPLPATESTSPQSTEAIPTPDLEISVVSSPKPPTRVTINEEPEVMEITSGSETPEGFTSSPNFLTPGRSHWLRDLAMRAVETDTKFQQVLAINVGKLTINLSNGSEVLSIWKTLAPGTGKRVTKIKKAVTLPMILFTEPMTSGSQSMTPLPPTSYTKHVPIRTITPLVGRETSTTTLPTLDLKSPKPTLEYDIDPRSIQVSVGPFDVRIPSGRNQN